jgi:3-deoxy-D-manno-octulosonic acid kinase
MHRLTTAPPGYSYQRIGTAQVVARDDVIDFVRQGIEEAGTLYRYAAAQPHAEPIRGRDTLFAIPGPAGRRWIVRRLTHGGLLAPVTGDRFLKIGTPRPFNELHLAGELGELGIPTPKVAAALVYPSGLLYRGEVAREEIAEAQDLAACLFGATRLDGARRLEVMAEAGRLVAALHHAGVAHPDLNLRNVLISWGAGPARAYILDLEKCRRVGQVSTATRQRMIARLRRSAQRFEERTGQRLGDDAWERFSAAYAGSQPS